MKLSTRSRYGLRAVCYLAENEDKGYIPVSEISEKLNLSENYLEQLVAFYIFIKLSEYQVPYF